MKGADEREQKTCSRYIKDLDVSGASEASRGREEGGQARAEEGRGDKARCSPRAQASKDTKDGREIQGPTRKEGQQIKMGRYIR